ncbi:SDR family NAD(P)-dependent oxidoreductase [Rhodococcus sp. T2V]|uniref:SDR family NAD(P)-dependent oxidoreductase n=1 Tax=Rhodococcus sp. T2V TaxID=3034164 RepID=UPI0023E0CF62|nr:SDR family NAD(P)-dependent oxidoreductase [Rhodococcus sp. T2V]MDF3311474.1 SDR family NAD(P)-dependent oxidoreductase [Rhodococcus sp. T2V]
MPILDGQVALVTGGGRGLGRSIAHAFAAHGAVVAIDDVYRDENGVAAAGATANEIEAAGGKALALFEDVTTGDGARAMVEATVERFGRLDILVTCAGNVTRGLLHELTEQQWDSLINLHLRGHFLSCKMALPHMLEQNSGRIITVGSRGAFFQVPASKKISRDIRKPPSTAYSAAKAGILGMSTTLAVELWETGITVNCLLPSATTQLFPETGARMVGGVPASASLDPDDIAPTVVYLASPDAADISGKIVYSSGGDLIFYGDQLDVRGSRMIRKLGRWTPEELQEIVPSMVGAGNE